VTGNPLARFEGLVALVTGAATGIGLATVQRLRAEGARVYATHHRTPLPAPDLQGAEPLPLDVTSEESWTAAARRIGNEAGRLDVLVNNAGRRESGQVEETTLDLWRRQIDVNLTSAFLGCRAMLPLLRAAGGGAIVNVSSITGIRGTEGMVAYSASKSGIVAMTASLALDLAPEGIRVNCVCPAAVGTRMVTDWLAAEPDPEATRARVAAKHPLGRIGRPEEVAGAIAFLASRDAGFMTGLAIPVDGGRSIR
jgi:NAD(P)-dependent dehydrogenase (short-subunit alcohol dehydrogenase family)